MKRLDFVLREMKAMGKGMASTEQPLNDELLLRGRWTGYQGAPVTYGD